MSNEIKILTKVALDSDQLDKIASKYKFDKSNCEVITDKTVQSGVVIKIGEEIYVDSIESMPEIIIVTTAHEADSEVKRIVSEKFNINLEKVLFKVDESLLGGIVIKTKNMLYDGSLKTKLEEIKTQLKR